MDPRHRTRNPTGRRTAIDPRARSYRPRRTWRATSSAVPNAGLGASADRATGLTDTPPERDLTWARHKAQRTKGTSNKPRVSASSGANAGASVNANLLNANVVEDWGRGSYLTESQGGRERDHERDRENYHSSVNSGWAGGAMGGGYWLNVLPADPR